MIVARLFLRLSGDVVLVENEVEVEQRLLLRRGLEVRMDLEGDDEIAMDMPIETVVASEDTEPWRERLKKREVGVGMEAVDSVVEDDMDAERVNLPVAVVVVVVEVEVVESVLGRRFPSVELELMFMYGPAFFTPLPEEVEDKELDRTMSDFQNCFPPACSVGIGDPGCGDGDSRLGDGGGIVAKRVMDVVEDEGEGLGRL